SLSSLRGQIGIVTQHTVSFNDTISANIAYGDLDATEEEIIAAAKKAYAHEFITQTAQSYQTIVGEQGATLSGGQLQRIAIARAILRNPAILIFDEAMSQIDADSEAKIQKALAEFARGRTSFIIAHRLSTIIDADRILVLDYGKLIAQGKHQELLKTCNLYRQLYEVQFVES
ncbi:MAG: ATP-binding cassette domain-containing protein, partial [Sedimentisphaerales bacterium]|nr:ATP-binding cassette domain-containing protein [Sedimentisphaerales bacterium]